MWYGTRPNYDEARAAESKPDFIHKLGWVLKELVETSGWLRFVVKTSLLTERKVASLLDEAAQLERIIDSSRLTAQSNRRKSLTNLQSTIFNQSCRMKMAILGAGAIGSAKGTLLHKAGNPVTLEIVD